MCRAGRRRGGGAVALSALAESTVPALRRTLVQRADDSDAVVLERLKVYHRQTEPLVQYYRHRPTFRSVDGAQSPDQVARRSPARLTAPTAAPRHRMEAGEP